MENITPEQALQTLYNATRQLNVNAETHETFNKLSMIIYKALTSNNGENAN